jgi:hypothetical protein
MRTIQIESTSPSFRRAARLARNGVLVLTEKGKPAFALVGVRDELALEALSLGRNPSFMAYLDELSLRAKCSKTYSLKEIREEFNIPTPTKRKRLGRKKPSR